MTKYDEVKKRNPIKSACFMEAEDIIEKYGIDPQAKSDVEETMGRAEMLVFQFVTSTLSD